MTVVKKPFEKPLKNRKLKPIVFYYIINKFCATTPKILPETKLKPSDYDVIELLSPLDDDLTEYDPIEYYPMEYDVMRALNLEGKYYYFLGKFNDGIVE